MVDLQALGQKAADICTAVVGSWPFIIMYNITFIAWLITDFTSGSSTLNLNLFLSWLAGVLPLIIMISQNRQEQLQRKQDKYMLHLLEAVQTQLKMTLANQKDNCQTKEELHKSDSSVSKDGT